MITQESLLLRQRSRAVSRQAFLFARSFFRYPKLLGSVVPSSPFLVRHLLSLIDWRRARIVVEYGPGVGTLTREILKRIGPEATLVAIELNPEFVEFLQNEIQDPRFRLVYGSAADVRTILRQLNLPHADYIISGIPYTLLPDRTRRVVTRESHCVLHPQGAFLVYQFTRTVLPYVKAIFGDVQQDFKLLNILPAHIYLCTP
ncbi:MAG TPA: methyltransferase domain-containing protein [Terriglobales bacterium]|jgi:phospholipid N-methyltransferase|nr:methyltransferase domain-containing protein [Terriglobales bacterium]